MQTLSVAEAADLIGCSRSTVYELIKTGQIPAIRISQRKYRVLEDGLNEWIAAGGWRP